MGTYANFMADAAYVAKEAGFALGIMIQNETDQADKKTGKTTGINLNDPFETLPVEEAGNDGVDEIVQGRHGPSTFSFSMILSQELVDWLPTRQSYIGRQYTILQYIAKAQNSAFVGIVTNAITGCRIESVQQQQGARGIVTATISGQAMRRYSGSEWATLTGAM